MPPQSNPNPSLPDDLILSCVARVSRLYYPTLSLVSKSFRSLLASPELYKTRSLLDRTESCLYVVSILDCTSNTWREGPSLRVKLMSCAACVLDGKIYVSGSCEDDDSATFQVFDTKTQTWDLVPIPCSETKHDFHYKIVCFDGKLHMVSNKGMDAYNTKEGRWDVVEPSREHYKYLYDSYSRIGNVWYSVLKGPFSKFIWYNTEQRVWRELKGMEGRLPTFPSDACVRLADYGGKMVVLWDMYVLGGKKMIWCAEIALERRGSLEIWGEVEWFDHMLTVPGSYEFVKVLSVTV
ncbi:unnamed protein product [Arabidopsis halleri]